MQSNRSRKRIDNAFKKKGQPLPKKWKIFFEEKFQTNFDPVRIVTGKVADRACEAADAVALTHEKKIVIRGSALQSLFG